jgi:hypothetical protein
MMRYLLFVINPLLVGIVGMMREVIGLPKDRSKCVVGVVRRFVPTETTYLLHTKLA